METRKARQTPRGLVALLAAFFGIGVIAVVFFVWVIPRDRFLGGMFEYYFPGLIPARSIAANLESNDRDLVINSLSRLRRRKNPLAVSKAVVLLNSTDAYIWFNVALYLGACEQQEAVPHLIKGLRHTAWRADNETVQTLRQLTKQNIGNDFTAWQNWWLTTKPQATNINWTSHLGSSPRLPSKPSDTP